VAVDSREAAAEEAGDLIAALESGQLDESAVTEIGALPSDWVAARPDDAITVFKSVGLAIQDVAAAELAVRSLA
jgi:ornithine cyclodeaminase